MTSYLDLSSAASDVRHAVLEFTTSHFTLPRRTIREEVGCHYLRHLSPCRRIGPPEIRTVLRRSARFAWSATRVATHDASTCETLYPRPEWIALGHILVGLEVAGQWILAPPGITGDLCDLPPRCIQ